MYITKLTDQEIFDGFQEFLKNKKLNNEPNFILENHIKNGNKNYMQVESNFGDYWDEYIETFKK